MNIYTVLSLLLASTAVHAVPLVDKMKITGMISPAAYKDVSTDCRNPNLGLRRVGRRGAPGVTMLNTICRSADTLISSSIPLDGCLANQDGKLVPTKEGQGTKSCEKITISQGSIAGKLTASCRARDGTYKDNVLELNSFLGIDNEGGVYCKA